MSSQGSASEPAKAVAYVDLRHVPRMTIAAPSAQSSRNPGVDMPLGRVDQIPSGVTGEILAYFTPDPLEALLSRCRGFDPPKRAQYDPVAALLLLRAASRDSDGSIDISQSRRLLSIMFGGREFCLESFLELARGITSKSQTVRNEIVFSGATIPSSAKVVYPPDDALPGLLKSIEAGFASEDFAALDPLLRSAVVGLYCSHVHPFLDGNGRWSRLMALYSMRQSHDAWPAMVGVAFMNACKKILAHEIWPEARTGGLRRYLDMAVEFDQALGTDLKRTGLADSFLSISRALISGSLEARRHLQLLGGVLVSDGMPIAALRSTLNLSLRAAEGRMRSASAASNLAKFDGERLNIKHLSMELDACIERVSNRFNS